MWRQRSRMGRRESSRLSAELAYAGRGRHNAPPFIRLAGNNAIISGFVITYPEWKQADVPLVPYPPCVCEGKENVKVSDCLLLNPYEGIKMVGRGAPLDSRHHRLSDQARHLCGRVL